MSKKKIGIPGWIGSGMFGITQPYAEFINNYGTVVILSPNDSIREDLDMLVLPGGADVNPARYGADNEVSFYTGNSNPMLEYFDTHKLPHYLEMKIGVLTVCRASQSLWAMFGGNIIQHNPFHKQSDYPKHECHELEWTTEELKKSFGKLIHKVNSRHHQTMDGSKYIPEELEVLAFAREKISDKEYFVDETIVEIFRHKEGHIYGFQGHPEDMPNDQFTPQIMHHLLNVKQRDTILI